MKLTNKEKGLIITSLRMYADEITEQLIKYNSSDRGWDKVNELNDLATYFEFLIVDEHYVR